MTYFLKYLHNYAETGFFCDVALLKALRTALASAAPPAVVLDIGCGRKPLARILRRYSARHVGLDVYRGKSVDVVCDGANMSFRAEVFDVALSTSVLEHCVGVRRVVQEAHRVLKPGGYFISSVPFMNPVHGAPQDYWRPTYYGLLELHKAYRRVRVVPVSSDLCTILNLMTSAMNTCFYRLLKSGRAILQPGARSGVDRASQSPEEKSGRLSMRLAYAMARLNPANFVLGLVALLVHLLVGGALRGGREGEMPVAYLVVAVK